MDIENRSLNIGQENKIAGDKVMALVKEFGLLGDTFKKSLLFKEKIRCSLDSQLADLNQQKNDNNQRLETLNANIRIYDENLDRISKNIEELKNKENEIKIRYEKLLKGSTEKEAELQDGDSMDSSEGSGDESTLECLIQKRQDFLDNLNENFKRMDEELLTIENLRKEIFSARDGILEKKELAIQKKKAVDERGKKIKESLERVVSELDKTIEEEKIITDNLLELMVRIEKSMELSVETDRVLFSVLTAAGSKP